MYTHISIYVSIYLSLSIQIYIYIYIYTYTLIELKFLDSSFSSSNLSIRAFRTYPLVEIR